MVATVNIADLTNEQLKPTATAMTTGSAPTAADPTVRLYAITTGGTAGTEILNLPNLPKPIGDYAPDYVGHRITFYIATQTDPSDAVSLTVDGSSVVSVFAGSYFANAKQQFTNIILLDYLGSAASFIWSGYKWLYDGIGTNQNQDGFYLPSDVTVTPAQAVIGSGDAGGNTLVYGGDSDGAGDAGKVRIVGGDCGDTGRGGNVEISAGSGNGVHANILILNLPSVDPGIADPTLIGKAIWLSGGTLKISAG